MRDVSGMVRMSSLAALLLATTACTTNPYTGEKEASNTGKGAAIGATAGAVIGALTGKDADDRRKRALIGAGIGGLGGAAVGGYMDAQEAKLREQLRNTGVSVTRLGDDIILNMPGNVTFDVNQADVKSNFYPVLNSVALVVKEYNKTLVDVNGHTDSTGTVELNMGLSNRRAQSVSSYLQSQGIGSNRLFTQGFGPHYPIADNTTAEGRQLNRRVEIVLKPLTQG